MAKKKAAAKPAKPKPKPTKSAKQASQKPALDATAQRKRDALQARVDQLDGKTLTRQQLRDIDWLIKLEAAATIESFEANLPKGEYCRLSGRQHKQLDDLAQRYALPFDGPTLNLGHVLTSLHDLIVDRQTLMPDDRAELEMMKLKKQIEGLELDNQKKLVEAQYARGKALPRDRVRESMIWLTARLRRLGQTLSKKHPDVRDDVNAFFEDLALELESGELRF